jgi:hypothetical protein
MACGLEACKNFKFQMLSLWYSFDQEFYADEEKHLEFLFITNPAKVSKELKKGMSFDLYIIY